jgi:hypothetical protein
MCGLSPLTCPVWKILPVATLPPAQHEETLMTNLFACKGLAATGDWRILHDEDLHDIKPNLILFGYQITGEASGI